MTGSRVDHVSLTVADIDRSLRFYHDLLGIPVLGRGSETGSPGTQVTGVDHASYLYADLDLGSGQLLELLQYLEPRGVRRAHRINDLGSGHFGLRVDDLETVLLRLGRAGFAPRSQPVLLEKPTWWRGAMCVYVTDPDGATVELVERPQGP
jgi:catechol 2,3-dioxygenase-like lactoylglutathione lyase family enzyme